MKKANFTSLLAWGCMMAALLFSSSAFAQAPAGSQRVTLELGTGAWNGEIGWELVDVTNGGVVVNDINGTAMQEFAPNFTPNSTYQIDLPEDTDYEFRATDTFGDGWNGATVTLTIVEDASNGGCATQPVPVLIIDNVEPGGAGQTFAFGISCPACELTCPADETISTDPGVCEAMYTDANGPVLTADCVGAAAGFVTVQSAQVDYLFTAPGGTAIDTPVPITGASASVGDVEVCVDYTGDNGGGATFELQELLAPDGTSLVTTVAGADCSTTAGNCATISAAVWNNIVNNSGPDFDFTWTGNTAVNDICVSSTVQASITYPTQLVTFTHTINGGPVADGLATGVLPLGDNEICYQSLDALGNLSQCCYTVTVEDNEDPVFVSCPTDITLNLDPGACETAYNYSVIAEDNCTDALIPGDEATLATLNAPNNGGAVGGMVYFTITNSSGLDLQLTQFELNMDGGTLVDVYLTPGGHAGNETNAGVWNLVGQADGTGGVGGNGLVQAPTDVVIPNGTWGVALHALSSAHNYTNGNGANQNYSDGTIELDLGSASNTPFGGTFIPRVFNGSISYISFVVDPRGPVTQTNGLPSGETFPIGSTVNTFVAEDDAGNTSVCEFTVTVNEFPNAITTLTCNNNIQVSLDEDCETTIGADMVLEGGPYGCYDNYDVTIISPTGQSLNTNVVDASFIGGVWTVRVTDPATGNSCWGTMTVEDKIDPVLECPDDLGVPCGAETAPGSVTDIVLLPATLNASEVNLEFNVPAGITVDDVDFLINMSVIEGSIFAGNVRVNLTSPAGTTVNAIITLFGGACEPGPLWVVFDDEGGTGLTCADFTTGINHEIPFGWGLLSAFDGEDAEGTWIYNVEEVGGAGTLSLTEAEVYINGVTYESAAQVGIPFPNGLVLTDDDLLDPNDPTTWVVDAPIMDACSDVILSYVDVELDGDCSGGVRTILRTWTAVDESGNEVSCTHTITIERPTLAEVSFPEDITWSCDEYNSFPNILDPTPITGMLETTGSGVPTALGIAFPDFCGITCESEDQELVVCEGTVKILRTWTCIDWCEGESISANQIVKSADEVGPNINAPAEQDIDVYQASSPASSQHTVCAGNIVVPPASGSTDNCSGLVSWTTEIWTADLACNPVQPIEVLEGQNGGVFFDIALKENGQPARYVVRYVAVDGCGNESSQLSCITLFDKIPPVAICDEITEITVTNNGATGEGCSTLFAEDLDDGSYDNCNPVWYLMARMDEAPFASDILTRCFYPSRDFCCADVGTTQQVILLVLDADPSAFFLEINQPFLGCDGTPGLLGTALANSNINYNTCMVDVIVDDKLAPLNTFCPGPATITCDNYWDNYEEQLLLCAQGSDVAQCQTDFLAGDFGMATFFDNCNLNITPSVNIDLDQCGVGTITRSWSAVDDLGNGPATCSQTIFVEHVSDWAVMFPDDMYVNCGEDEPDYGEPTLYFETCELLAVSFEDELFTTVPGVCYQITRQWTVINWCTVGTDIADEVIELPEASYSNFPPVDFNGNGRNIQENNPLDNPPFVIGHSWRTFRENRGQLNAGGGAPTAPTSPDEIDNGNAQDGYITYQQVILVIDEVAPVFDDCSIEDMCIFDGCTMTVSLPQPTVSDCSAEITVEVESTTLPGGSGFGPYFNVPPGTYTVVYKATDNCGNFEVCETEFTVEDCKNPTPYCKDGLIIEMMNTTPPMVDVWASDFDAGSFDNCQVVCVAFSNDCDDTQRVYDCDDLGENPVQIWVYDGTNWDFCETFVVIQDNMGLCEDDDQLVGNIGTETNDDVASVDVYVNGTNNFNDMYTTDATGMYDVTVPTGGDYTITPEKDIDHLNGVTTFDLVVISKHILNVDLLDSPYQMIAADVNKSNGITTFDLVAARKLILYIDSEFPNNTSWRFVPRDYEFSNPANPFADNFPEVINVNNISQDMLDQDFVAIKVGDVNGSANTNNLLGTDDRTFNGALTLTTEDIRVEAGKTYTVEFTANNFDHLGYQFTLNYNGLEFVEVGEGLATADNFGMALLSENVITASWSKAEAVKLATNEAVFTMTFTAQTDAQLSDLLSIDSRYTVAESYASNGNVQDVNLEFNGTVVEAGFELYQNSPNPFSDATVIGFNLPTATTATITISDISGRVLRVIEGDFAKGYNQVDVSRDEIPATGVLYYQLDTDNNSATKKMIIIE